MIEHLKIKNKEHISISTLTDLGKINIICGKNSSGKSAILNCIANENDIFLGKTLTETEVEELENAYKGARLNTGWSGGVNHPNHYKPYYHQAIENLKKTEITLFFDEESDFIENINKKFQTAFGKESRNLITDQIGRTLQTFFSETYKTTLLPPKRILSGEEEISFSKAVEPTGQWPTNKLLFAKTQPPGSETYRTYEEIQKRFTEISSGHKFDVFSGTTNEANPRSLAKLKFASEYQKNWISAEECGSGLRDLLIILYFSVIPEYQIILIEEPENHIHPEIQRKLLRFLKLETDKQYFITTHSNIFLNTTYADRIFYSSYENGTIKVSDATKRTEILNELGYSVSGNLVSDLIILVEGPTDVPIIEEYLKKFGIDASYNIKIWALGGDIMAQLDLTVFAEKYRVIALIDKDPKSASVRRKFINKCKDLNIPVTTLKRYAIENYFSVRALREIFKGQIPVKFTEINYDKSLQEQIEINVKNSNRRLAQEMNLEQIEETDLYKFFKEVERLCKS